MMIMMNNKEKSTIGEMATHIEYIRKSIDEIKELTKQQQKQIDENKLKIERITTVGSLMALGITIVLSVVNIFF